MPTGVNEQMVINVQKYAEIYYSLYSVDPAFRKRWLPKAMPVGAALAIIMRNDITIHHALIRDENDRALDAIGIIDTIVNYKNAGWGGAIKLNLVVYNPFSDNQGERSDGFSLKRYKDILEVSGIFKSIKLIPRVGFDVKASCGMFIDPKDIKVKQNDDEFPNT